MKIINLDNCDYSEKIGGYGGNAGLKDGIIYNGDNYLIKFPKSTVGMRVKDLSYTTSPFSEYLGSSIYKILGYDVHDTFLCCRKDKIAVACKDFEDNTHSLREIRTLKNMANFELEQKLEQAFGYWR